MKHLFENEFNLIKESFKDDKYYVVDRNLKLKKGPFTYFSDAQEAAENMGMGSKAMGGDIINFELEKPEGLDESAPRMTDLYKKVDSLRQSAGHSGAGAQVLSLFEQLLEAINDDIIIYDEIGG